MSIPTQHYLPLIVNAARRRVNGPTSRISRHSMSSRLQFAGLSPMASVILTATYTGRKRASNRQATADRRSQGLRRRQDRRSDQRSANSRQTSQSHRTQRSTTARPARTRRATRIPRRCSNRPPPPSIVYQLISYLAAEANSASIKNTVTRTAHSIMFATICFVMSASWSFHKCPSQLSLCDPVCVSGRLSIIDPDTKTAERLRRRPVDHNTVCGQVLIRASVRHNAPTRDFTLSIHHIIVNITADIVE